MPPAPVDRRENPIRKWVSNFLPGGADTKMRACGVGVPDSVQQVGHQDPAPEIPPPVPAKPTVTDAMPPAGEPQPKPKVPPMMPELPGGTHPLPILPAPAAVSPPTAPAMPIADPPAVDPTKSVITDPVQQLP